MLSFILCDFKCEVPKRSHLGAFTVLTLDWTTNVIPSDTQQNVEIMCVCMATQLKTREKHSREREPNDHDLPNFGRKALEWLSLKEKPSSVFCQSWSKSILCLKLKLTYFKTGVSNTRPALISKLKTIWDEVSYLDLYCAIYTISFNLKANWWRN